MDWEKEKELNPNLEPGIIYLILRSVAEGHKVPKELEKPVEDIIRAMEQEGIMKSQWPEKDKETLEEYVNKAMLESGISEDMYAWKWCKEYLFDIVNVIVQYAYRENTSSFDGAFFEILKLCAYAYKSGIQEDSFTEILKGKVQTIMQLSLGSDGHLITNKLVGIIGIMNDTYIKARFF